MAEALVKGRILRIEGGSYELMHAKRCPRLNRRNIMSIVAISAEGPSVDDAVDPRYGRAGGFVLAAFPHGDLSLAPSITATPRSGLPAPASPRRSISPTRASVWS